MARLILVVATATGVMTACSPPPTISKFEVAVVGNGVPQEAVENPPLERDFPKDESKGRAIWSAARLALQSDDFSELASVIELRPYDDFGNDHRAASIARELRVKPSVLAVIGHTASGTTQAAAHIYDGAGIPVLMPIATSPGVMFPPGREGEDEDRLKRVFRLPPADDRVQAPAVAWLVTRQLHSQRVYVVGDTSPGAEAYSRPLCENAGRLMDGATTVHPLHWVDGNTDDMGLAARKVHGWKADTIVFCGYTSTALQLLQRLREQYATIPVQSRPILIFTDGVLDESLDARGFRALLTFPLPTLESLGARDEAKQLEGLLGKGEIESYEIYAYDAMLILRDAIRRCEAAGGLSRSCVTQKVGNTKGLRGVAFSYTFLGGENIESSYHVYEYNEGEGEGEERNPHFIYSRALTANELSEITGNA